MEKQRGFTLVELLVVIAVIALFMAILIPMLKINRKEPRWRPVCLSNLKQLTLGWVMYADDNDGKLVNGIAGGDPDPDGDGMDEMPWVPAGDPTKRKLEQETAIKAGALWPYIKNVKVYRCPQGNAGHIRTYSVVDALFGEGWGTNDPRYWIKDRLLIGKPYERIVFIDEGKTENGSYRIDFFNASWEDTPPVRHRDGATVSFADAHSAYWKWTMETAEAGKKGITDFHPQTHEGIQDLKMMQEAVWGRLGY